MTAAVITAPLLGTASSRTNRIARSTVLIAGFALLTAAFAQIEIPLWFTPVPITGQTLAVLLAGAALGSKLGAASQTLYVGLGALGLPFYSGGDGGWEAATGVTAGYLAGFIAAAAVVGLLAEQRRDRRVATSIPAFLAGSAVIYFFGVSWLTVSLDVSVTHALELGMVPFVIGDLVKVALAGLVLPAAWRFVSKRV